MQEARDAVEAIVMKDRAENLFDGADETCGWFGRGTRKNEAREAGSGASSRKNEREFAERLAGAVRIGTSGARAALLGY